MAVTLFVFDVRSQYIMNIAVIIMVFVSFSFNNLIGGMKYFLLHCKLCIQTIMTGGNVTMLMYLVD